MAFADALPGAQSVQLGTLGPAWARCRQQRLVKKLGGNDLPDAGLAAATMHPGEPVVSFDRDFRQGWGVVSLRG